MSPSSTMACSTCRRSGTAGAAPHPSRRPAPRRAPRPRRRARPARAAPQAAAPRRGLAGEVRPPGAGRRLSIPSRPQCRLTLAPANAAAARHTARYVSCITSATSSSSEHRRRSRTASQGEVRRYSSSNALRSPRATRRTRASSSMEVTATILRSHLHRRRPTMIRFSSPCDRRRPRPRPTRTRLALVAAAALVCGTTAGRRRGGQHRRARRHLTGLGAVIRNLSRSVGGPSGPPTATCGHPRRSSRGLSSGLSCWSSAGVRQVSAVGR